MHTIRPEQDKWCVMFESDSAFRRVATCGSADTAAAICSWLNGGLIAAGALKDCAWYGAKQ